MKLLLVLIIIALLFLCYWLYTKIRPPKGDSDLIHFFQLLVTSLRERDTPPPLGVLIMEKDIMNYFEGLYLWIVYDPDDMEETHKTGTEENPLPFEMSFSGSQAAMSTGMNGEGHIYFEGVKYRASNQIVSWRNKLHNVFIVEPFEPVEGQLNYVFKKKTI